MSRFRQKAWAIFSADADSDMIFCDLETGVSRREAFEKVARIRKDRCCWVSQGDNPCTYTAKQLRKLADALDRIEREASMSQYLEFETCIRSEEALISALVEMGFKREHIEVFAEPQPLYGYLGDERKEKAHIVIRRQHVGRSSNDLGFERTANGYVARISQFDQRKYDKRWLDELAQRGAVHVAKAQARKVAKLWKEEKTKEGVVRMVFRA